MKITPTMPREHRNSGFASPVFHPNKWPNWSDRPYHRDEAAPIKKIRMPRNAASEEQEREHWPKVVAFWKQVRQDLQRPLCIFRVS